MNIKFYLFTNPSNDEFPPIPHCKKYALEKKCIAMQHDYTFFICP